MLTRISNMFIQKFPKYSAILLNELPVHELEENRPALQSGYSKGIPPNVYQSWANNRFGKTHLQQLLFFRAVNPDLNFFLLSDKDVNAYMHEFWGGHPIFKIYCSAKYGQMKNDIFRYCILYERGGFYFDINKGISKPISSLLEDGATGFISFERNDCIIMPDKILMSSLMHPEKYVLQWGFGFCEKHPMLTRHLITLN
jgi:mannosyltransferase OCH1-like enzyme